jgi:Domain of unknown function (DUF4347)
VIIDVVDATSPQDAHEIQAIKAAGSEPIIMQGMCGAVGQVVQEIISRARGHRQIVLLRFHGHGAPGMMNFGAGTEAHFEHQSGVSVGNFGSVASELARLKLFFAPHGRVELHGCNVAQGNQGEKFIRNLALLWGVPVSAGIASQYGGGAAQFQFEGRVHTARPDGSLSSGVPSH